jgi:hypothetical protein
MRSAAHPPKAPLGLRVGRREHKAVALADARMLRFLRNLAQFYWLVRDHVNLLVRMHVMEK